MRGFEMPYVTAYYAPPLDDPLMAAKPGGANRVIAIDDQGLEWHLTDDSQVGDWLRYVEADGEVLSSDEYLARNVEPVATKSTPKGKKR
jgi:hypothetical protein